MMKSVMPSLSKVARASTNSKSVRATIPEDIAEQLEVDVGDLLVWKIEEQKGKKRAIIEKWES
ncbi:hypothetical protein NsoK4_06875 [Nitrosopumilus sp. K4]|uniref:hypothetical protein n=1 Tax=Nitrosopumilus sp. K4 TaxID=2795383 RepID=UPI001BAAE79B|nr:hypothetical protein [Nitrosopumilus sp. K4]QUC64163.1 hypothetical protein NsoK4_06875 [Nitrosopumilus sp. K4]